MLEKFTPYELKKIAPLYPARVEQMFDKKFVNALLETLTSSKKVSLNEKFLEVMK